MVPLPPPEPVKLLAAILWSEAPVLAEARALLSGRLGAIDHEGEDHPFAATDYYRSELGEGLKRRLVSFAPLIAPEAIVEAKLAAMEIEARLAVGGRRRVNIDAGYLDVHKVVLASSKFAAPKVHLGRGVYADLALRYAKGRFHPFEWTFADFRDGSYERDLVRIRERYKEALRILGAPP